MAKQKDAIQDSQTNRVDVNDRKASRKRKKDEPEQVTTVIPDTPSERKEAQNNKKDKKHKKKKKKTEQIEISDPPTFLETVHKGEEDLSSEERRALERKMKKILKKEKNRLKEQGETQTKNDTSGPTAAQLALDYLTCWAENRGEWKFQKTRQTWLLQHMFDSEKVSDSKFSVLLQYLEGLQGAAKDTTVQKALALVQQSGDASDTDIQQRAHRAREAIQLLT